MKYIIVDTTFTSENLPKSESQTESIEKLASDWLVYDEIISDSNDKVCLSPTSDYFVLPSFFSLVLFLLQGSKILSLLGAVLVQIWHSCMSPIIIMDFLYTAQTT